MDIKIEENIQEKVYLPLIKKENNQQNDKKYFHNEENAKELAFLEDCEEKTFISNKYQNLFISDEDPFKYSELLETVHQPSTTTILDENSINSLKTEDLNENPPINSSKMESRKKTNRGRRGSKRNNEFRGEKPKDTYIELIGEAIEKHDSKRATLAEIYEYLKQKDEFFRGKYIGWKNSIRHNLSSIFGYFKKLPKNSHGKIGKGHLWTCSPKFKSFIEEKHKNLISSSKQKTTKIKSESFNKQIELNKELQDQQQNTNLIDNNNSVDDKVF
uniref:Fork-head domain-containing protein n=2 Tax=Meloidogyne TaxID=189290 RepID=A0A6V7X3Y2_MELEN|nr:unnamed protein product [Meloidogyne enterolobii]